MAPRPEEVSADRLSLHRQRVERVVRLIMDLEQVFKELEMGKELKAIRNAGIRLSKGEFNIAVVGEFKRGKSTLINALLGQSVLPSDALPCSAALTRIVHGERSTVEAYFKDGTIRTLPVEKLVEYGSKLTPEFEANSAQVTELVVKLPLPLCKNGVSIIDTPGLNDDDDMTQVTSRILPSVDAVLFVITAGSPFSNTESTFLLERLLTQDIQRVIVVVNRINDISPDQRSRRGVERKASRQSREND